MCETVKSRTYLIILLNINDKTSNNRSFWELDASKRHEKLIVFGHSYIGVSVVML